MTRDWKPAELSELMRQYQGSCVLLAGCELDVFSLLQKQPIDAAAAARALGADVRGMAALLDALVAIGVLEKREGRYSMAAGVGPVLTAGGSESMLAMAQHQANCLRSWADLARVVKSGRPHRKEPSIRGDAADYAAFIEAMDNISRVTAPPLVAALPPLQFKHLLDVGGASGTWTIAFLKRYPEARATLFDLPKVLPQATQRLTAADMISRVRLVGGDFMVDPLPPGADMAWVSAIIHQMSREDCRKLYSAVLKALTPGGQILIRDHVMEEDRTQPAAGALFAINMLVNTDTGGTFTLSEISEDLEAAGFISPAPLKLDETMSCVIQARKPEL